MSSLPAPPGTQITSSCGQSANVVVGVNVSTESLGTGSIRFQIRCTLAPGTLENTCKGPVKSSWVTFGKITRPICSGADIGKPPGFWLDGSYTRMMVFCRKWHISLDFGHE